MEDAPCPKKFIGSVNRIHPSGLDGVLVVQERLGRKERNDFMFKDAEFHIKFEVLYMRFGNVL